MSLRINDLAPDFTAETTQGKSWWASEAMVNFGRERGEPTRMQSLEWENRFQFTTTPVHSPTSSASCSRSSASASRSRAINFAPARCCRRTGVRCKPT